MKNIFITFLSRLFAPASAPIHCYYGSGTNPQYSFSLTPQNP